MPFTTVLSGCEYCGPCCSLQPTSVLQASFDADFAVLGSIPLPYFRAGIYQGGVWGSGPFASPPFVFDTGSLTPIPTPFCGFSYYLAYFGCTEGNFFQGNLFLFGSLINTATAVRSFVSAGISGGGGPVPTPTCVPFSCQMVIEGLLGFNGYQCMDGSEILLPQFMTVTSPTMMGSAERPPQSIAEWPLAARLVARFRAAADAGLGDTVARHLDRFGADAFKRLYRKLTGSDCGCSDRQAALNFLYPYSC